MRFVHRLAVLAGMALSGGCGLIVGFGDDPRARGEGDSGALVDAARGDEGSVASETGKEDGDSAPSGPGYVYFRMDGYGAPIFRVKAEEGATREDVGALLRANNGPAAAGFDPAAMYEFRHFTVARNGSGFAVQAGRYSPTGAESFYVGKPGEWKLTKMVCSAIDLPGTNDDPDDRGLLSSDGQRVVFSHGYDETDSGARREGIWVAPVTGPGRCGAAEPITPSGAEYLLHALGSLSPDETKVVTLCKHPSKPVAVCEQSLTKPYATTTLFKSDRAEAGHVSDLGFPSYDRDGSILFSAQWYPGVTNRSQIYRYRAPATYEKLTSESDNNWDPCVFANGDIATKTYDNGKVRLRILKKGGGTFTLDVVLGADQLSNTLGLYCAG